MNTSRLGEQIWFVRTVLTATVGLSLAACGALPSSSIETASSARSASPPAPSPSPASGYTAYSSPKWQYSLDYPSSWYSLPVKAGTDYETDKYFSNENIGSPEGMDAGGVFVTITVDSTGTKQCAPGPGWNDPTLNKSPLTIDGESTTEILPNNGAAAVVQHYGWCYWFSFLTGSTVNRDQHNAEIAHMLSSFKFNR